MIDHKAGKRHCEVISQAFLAYLLCYLLIVAACQVFVLCKVARVQYFEQQLVSLFAIFPHQGIQALQGRRFNLLKAVKSINLSDCVENIVAFLHLHRQKVSCSLDYLVIHVVSFSL